MRLPLRHCPPANAPAFRRCAYLEALAVAAVGLPLAPVADILLADAGRGRHGNALQWHLGLAARDGSATLDWEDRIEIKLVSVWRRPNGALTCDKLKVCDVNVDPWHKLSNVLWVFADRCSRLVLGYRFFHLNETELSRLAGSWACDPHFSNPELFVEARESATSIAPAYYLSANWLIEQGFALATNPLVYLGSNRTFAGDSRLIVADGHVVEGTCPQCNGSLIWRDTELKERGWSHCEHAGFRGLACENSLFYAIDGACIPESHACSRDEQVQALAGTLRYETLWRLADRIPEPEDHLH
jgi:predicted RNA-binding Zn-ribbon protein involved in translation (DUF1610 family)